MSRSDDYFYRRNLSVKDRLLKGDNPSIIAKEYGMTKSAVVAMFPVCNYELFKRAVRRRFAMGETSYEIACFTNLDHRLILTTLNLSFARESQLYAILRMHDNGFSVSRIGRVSLLPEKDIKEILKRTGRDKESMPYYKAIGQQFTVNVDDEDWQYKICKLIMDREMPNYLMTLENKVEEKYRSKAKDVYHQIASENLDDNTTVGVDDYEYVEKVIKKMRRLKGVTRKELITKAVIHYAKASGVAEEGGGFGGKEATRINNNLHNQVDQFYASMAEIKNMRHDEIQDKFLENYKTRRRD